MSELDIPESWVQTTLGEVGTTMIGLTYSPSDISTTGIPVLRSGNIQKGKLDLTGLVRVTKKIKPDLIVRSGDILICARNGSRALVGKAALIKSIEEQMTFGAFMAIYRSPCNEYIEKFLNSPLFRRHLEGVSTATINQITQSNLKGIALPLPPLAEQKRIVAKIESTFQKIESVEAAANEAEKLLKKYRESLLAKAFCGELVPQDPNDVPASKFLQRIRVEQLKDNSEKKSSLASLPPLLSGDIPFSIPHSWSWARVGELVRLKNGYAFKSEYFKPDGPYVLTTPGNFYEQGGFRDQGTKTKFYDGPIKSEFIFKGGELITAMTEQAPGLLGSAAFIPKDGREYIHNQRLGHLIPYDVRAITLEYLYWYFNAPYLRARLSATCSGSTVRHTSPDRILSVPIPIPPINEQRRITEAVQKHYTTASKISAICVRLFQDAQVARNSILTKAFLGHLVEQDISEGNGHELLAQIKVASEKKSPKVSSRKKDKH